MTDMQSGMGWTPGPWHVLDHIRAGPTIVCNREQKHIADCDFQWWPEKQNAANARLIAAAPELYEALLGLLESPLTTLDPRNPSDWPKLVEFWEGEKEQGRGDAAFQLAAYAALARAQPGATP